MWNLYCLFEFINSSFAYVQVHEPVVTIHTCVTIAVVFLLHYRKTIFNQVRHFIHVNLSAALLLGLIVFVSGIEAASGFRVSNNIHIAICMQLII